MLTRLLGILGFLPIISGGRRHIIRTLFWNNVFLMTININFLIHKDRYLDFLCKFLFLEPRCIRAIHTGVCLVKAGPESLVDSNIFHNDLILTKMDIS